MERIVELLTEKNNCLEKFYRLNETELMNFSEGNFENLETFYNSRETILEMVQAVDRMIDSVNQIEDVHGNIDDDSKKKIINALSYKSELVTRILSQDLQILSFIETAKSDIIKELAQVRAARKALAGYQSSGSVAKRLEEEY